MCEDVLPPELGESYEETLDRTIPMGRDQTREHTGRAVFFIAVKRSITGEPVVVDGGILQNVIQPIRSAR